MEFGDFITEGSKQQGKRLPFKNYNRGAEDSPIKSKPGDGRKSTVKQPKGHEAAKRNQAYGGESEEQYNPPKYKAIKQELRDNDGKGQVMVPGKPPYSKNALGPKKPQIVRGDSKKVEKELEGEGGKEAVQKLVKKNLEKTYKKDSEGHPKLEEERMNFTDYINSAVSPLYEKEGEIPKCPPGYIYDVKLVMCVPKTKKDAIGDGQKSGNKDSKPGNGASYNVWGNSGYSGSGYAWEEQPTSHDNAGSGGGE